MPDQYGKVTGRDWLGLSGAISSIDSMRRGQKYLEMREAGEGRATTEFEQSQEDRAFNDLVKKNENEYVGNLTTGGLIDERGNPTDSWNSTISKNLAESTRETTAAKKKDVEKELEAQGTNALASFTAKANINNQLAGNAQSNKILTQTALDKGRGDFKNIKEVMTTANDYYRQGNSTKALKMAKEALDNSVVRRTGEVVGDKLHIIETVAGVKHRGPGLAYPEIKEFIDNYNMEEHSALFAADAQTGREMALKPPMRMRTPDDKTVLVKQTGTSFGVDYFFFNPDGSPYRGAPKDLEQAYGKGWMPEEDLLKRERAGTKEVREEKKIDLEERRIAEYESRTGAGAPTDKTAESLRKYGEKRMKYIDSNKDEYLHNNPDVTPEEAENVLVGRFNTETMGWESVGTLTNKKDPTKKVRTWRTPEGVVVNDYGVAIKMKKGSGKTRESEGGETPAPATGKKKPKGKPKKLAKNLKELDAMVPVMARAGRRHTARRKKLDEPLMELTGQKKGKGKETIIASALRRSGVKADNLQERLKIEETLHAVYKDMSDKEIANAILRGKLLGGVK